VREERRKGKLLAVDLRDGYRASACAILDALILGAVRV
jgi:hypothetical protein